MTEEIKRRDQAIGHLFRRLNEVASQTYWNQIHEEVQALLNPPPEYEDVEEIVGWVNVYRYANMKYHTGETVYPTMELADESAGDDRLFCQPIRVTVKREKKRPVEYTLTLDKDEAETLLHVCHSIGGSPFSSRRRHMDNIGIALEECGIVDNLPADVCRLMVKGIEFREEDPTT